MVLTFAWYRLSDLLVRDQKGYTGGEMPVGVHPNPQGDHKWEWDEQKNPVPLVDSNLWLHVRCLEPQATGFWTFSVEF